MYRGVGKGILLLIATNILIMITLAVVLNVLQALGVMPEGEIGYLLVLSLIWGFGGAFLSLAISRWAAKKMLGVQVIDPRRAGQYDWLVQMVHNQARASRLPAMPEVGVYHSPEMNAFATGPTRSRSLVAFSSGILSNMSREELEGVSAHEVAHVQNGDMMAMTLLQGVVNAFALFFAKLIGRLVASRFEGRGAQLAVYIGVQLVAQILFLILGSIVVAWFSRLREFRADAGSAKVSGRRNMVAALKALQRQQNARIPDEQRIPDSVAALGINGKPSRMAMLFASHPPLEQRIARLETGS